MDCKCTVLLLEGGDPIRRGGLIEAPHVLVHLWKTLLHVVLCTALSHGSKPKPPGGVVELWRGHQAALKRQRTMNWQGKEMEKKKDG